ncbi:MAG: hypothetical protein AAF988_02920, partial [Pseudomonadota bacterium]
YTYQARSDGKFFVSFTTYPSEDPKHNIPKTLISDVERKKHYLNDMIKLISKRQEEPPTWFAEMRNAANQPNNVVPISP